MMHLILDLWTGQIATVDLIKICYEIGLLVESQPVLNTPILGSVMKIEDKISLDDLNLAIRIHFGEVANRKKCRMPQEWRKIRPVFINFNGGSSNGM